MQTMKDFAAQQLTKKQMNEVKGGGIRTSCVLELSDGTIVDFPIVDRKDFDAVETELQNIYDEIGLVSCMPYLL